MKRKVVSVLLAGAMALSLTACGGSNGSAPASTGNDGAAATDSAATQAATADVASEDEHTLSVYAWDKNFNIPALKAAEADYQKNVDPEFKLNIIEQSQSSDVETAITTAASAGDFSTLPDIVLFQDHWIQNFVTNYPDAWKDLSAADIDWSDFGAEKLSYSTINDVHYGVPVDNGTVIFAYRTDLLEAAGYSIDDVTGVTWDKWIEIGSDVYEKTGKYLLSMDGDGNDLPYMMLQAEGKSQFDENGDPQLTSEDVKAVVDVITRAQKANALYLANDWSDYTDQTIVGDMVAGVMNGNWIIPTIEQVAENSGKWEITTCPTLTGAEGYASNGGSSLYVTANCKNTDLANDFLAKTFGAGSTETYDAALKNGGVITCSTKAGSSDVYNEGVEYFNNQAIYSTIVEFGTHVPVVKQSDFHYTAREQVAAAIQNILGGADIDSALKDAQDQLMFAMGK
ncbi:lactose/L-arabinose transport system substrate-binding protein [Lachnospiraceae bacterium]|nr:lactose/L-arabinose transport system substrate-binding protein [Lachnospiraceae bacterium]